MRILPAFPTTAMEAAAVEVEVAATMGCFGGDGDDDLDVDPDDDLSIGAEVTCAVEDSDSGASVSEVSILEELLNAENGNGDALACLQVKIETKLRSIKGCCSNFATIMSISTTGLVLYQRHSS